MREGLLDWPVDDGNHLLFFWSVFRGTQRLFPVNYLFKEALKYCLEFSSWGLLEISGWPFHTGTIFEAYFINPHYNFLKFNFSHFTRHAGLIFARNPKIFLFKNVMERGLRQNLIFVKRQIASKTFGKLIRYDTIRYDTLFQVDIMLSLYISFY